MLGRRMASLVRNQCLLSSPLSMSSPQSTNYPQFCFPTPSARSNACDVWIILHMVLCGVPFLMQSNIWLCLAVGRQAWPAIYVFLSVHDQLLVYHFHTCRQSQDVHIHQMTSLVCNLSIPTNHKIPSNDLRLMQSNIWLCLAVCTDVHLHAHTHEHNCTGTTHTPLHTHANTHTYIRLGRHGYPAIKLLLGQI